MAEIVETTASKDLKLPRKITDAVDDKATTDENNPVTINVLSNDKNAIGISETHGAGYYGMAAFSIGLDLV